MTWGHRVFPNRVARPARHDAAEPSAGDGALDGLLGFITAVYGVALSPSDPLVMHRLGHRGPAGADGASLEQISRLAGETTAATCQMLVDHLPFAVVIADVTSRVLLANAPALRDLRAGPMIASGDGRLRVADPAANDLLRAAIERACTRQGSDLLPVLVPVAPEAPWQQVVVMGIVRRTDACYAALLFPDSQRLNGAARILASLFSFTAAEARMAVLILEGRTLAQAASALGIRTRTALETWKNVRLKLRTGTDSDCVRVLGGALLITESPALPPPSSEK